MLTRQGWSRSKREWRPKSVRVTQRALHYFVGQADWSDGAVLDAVRARVLPVIAQSGPIRGWMLNDIGTPKKGTHSVGVVRQSCGHLGRQDNCQVAVTLSVANDQASLPIAHRLFLPRAWADQPRRRARVGVPDEVAYQTRPQIALAQVCAALAAGVPPAPVLAGVGYGIDSDFRDALTKLGLQYVVGIQPSTSLWLPRVEPARTDRGKSSSVAGRNQDPKPVSATELVTGIPKSGWRPVTWLEGGDALLTSRFAAVRVRSAHGDEWRSAPRPEEWLLVEWPTGQPEPIGYWLATLPETTPRRTLVNLAKLRWQIERDHQELEQDFGFGHYGGRSWRGFHHHATLRIAAYGFRISERGGVIPTSVAS